MATSTISYSSPLAPTVSSSERKESIESPLSALDEKIKTFAEDWLVASSFTGQEAQAWLQHLADFGMIYTNSSGQLLFKEGRTNPDKAIPSPQNIEVQVKEEGLLVIPIQDQFKKIWLVASRIVQQESPAEAGKVVVASAAVCLGKKEGTLKSKTLQIATEDPHTTQLMEATFKERESWLRSRTTVLSTTHTHPITQPFSIDQVPYEIGKWLLYADTRTMVEKIFKDPQNKVQENFGPIMRSPQEAVKRAHEILNTTQQTMEEIARRISRGGSKGFSTPSQWDALEKVSKAQDECRKYEGIYRQALQEIEKQLKQYLCSLDNTTWDMLIDRAESPPPSIIEKMGTQLAQKFQQAYPLPERPYPLWIDDLFSDQLKGCQVLIYADPKLYEEVIDPLLSDLAEKYHYHSDRYEKTKDSLSEVERNVFQAQLAGKLTELPGRIATWCCQHPKLQAMNEDQVKRIVDSISDHLAGLYGLSL